MTFVLKGPQKEPVVNVEVCQDGKDVNIKINGKVIAWLNADRKELSVYKPALDYYELGVKIYAS